jgi:hypothetical protein
MLDKKRGYAEHRPFYAVDPNADIMAGKIAYLTTNAAGTVIATTATLASGGQPIGTFWKDRAAAFVRTTVESGTFTAGGTLNLLRGNVTGTSAIKVTSVAGGTVYTQGVDYSVAIANGVVTNLGVGIPALATVVIWYAYNVLAGQEHEDLVSTQWSTGVNYDRQANDTLGSGEITVVEGDATLYTDQYDPTQTYLLNAQVGADALSRWTVAASAVSNPCGFVVSVPTANDPFLGVKQVRIL